MSNLSEKFFKKSKQKASSDSTGVVFHYSTGVE